MVNKDRQMLNKCVKGAAEVFRDAKCEHPLDEEIIAKLRSLYNKIDKDS